jgi:hypothetical protein
MLLNYGDRGRVIEAVYGEISSISAIARNFQPQSSALAGQRENILVYAQYLESRTLCARQRHLDLSVKSNSTPDYRKGDVAEMLGDGTFDTLIALLMPLTAFRFFVDDFNVPVVLQAVKTIFDDFIYLYGCLTELMVNLFGNLFGMNNA